MAKSLLNSGIEQLRGTLDQWVYKVVRGKRVIARRPRPNPNRQPSPTELDTRARFRDAADYGRSVLADPPRRIAYTAVARLQDKPVFSVILADFYSKPVVYAIDLDAYHGHVGDKIVVRAGDRSGVSVASLKVAIRHNGTQAVLESGAALLVGNDWVYTATTALPAGQPVTIEATVKDRPGNETTDVKVYP